jgi:hypothetical protein
MVVIVGLTHAGIGAVSLCTRIVVGRAAHSVASGVINGIVWCVSTFASYGFNRVTTRAINYSTDYVTDKVVEKIEDVVYPEDIKQNESNPQATKPDTPTTPLRVELPEVHIPGETEFTIIDLTDILTPTS